MHYAIIGCFGGGWEGELVVEVASDHDASVKGYADRMYGGLKYPSRHHRLDPGARPRLACPRLHRGARRGSLLAA